MVDYQTISILFTGLSISLAAFYYILTLRNTQRTRELTLESQELSRKAQEQALETRQAQLFMNIYGTYTSKQYQKDQERMLLMWEYEGFDDFFNKYGLEANPEEHAIWDMFSSHFRGIGVLVKRGLIDSKLVYDLMNWSIITFWDKFETVLVGQREEEGPETYQDLEFLYNEMKRIRIERGDRILPNQ